MPEVRRADPVARRRAVVFVVGGAFVGALLVVGFERYRARLRDWVRSEPQQLPHRLRLVLLLSAAVLSVPLFGFAASLWSLGGSVRRAEQFPPPGYRIIRDTPLLQGQAAVSRARRFRVLAICLAVASALLWLLCSRLASVL